MGEIFGATLLGLLVQGGIYKSLSSRGVSFPFAFGVSALIFFIAYLFIGAYGKADGAKPNFDWSTPIALLSTLIVSTLIIFSKVKSLNADKSLERPTGWQRIGIVFSVLWVLGSFGHVFSSHVKDQSNSRSWRYEYCQTYENKKPLDCWEEAVKYSKIPYTVTNLSYDATIYSFLPIALGWFLSFIFVRTYRWIRSGF